MEAVQTIMIDPQALRNTMRYWASGVSVVTTADADGRDRAGMTVSAFNSLSADNATVLVCLLKNTTTTQRIQETGQFAVSMLAQGDDYLSNRFAGRIPLAEGEDRFDGVATTLHETGSPVLDEALAWVDCRVVTIHDGGSHDIVIGEVMAAGASGGAPLVYFDRQYRTLATLTPSQ